MIALQTCQRLISMSTLVKERTRLANSWMYGEEYPVKAGRDFDLKTDS